MNRRPLWVALWLAALLWIGALWLSGQVVSPNWLRLFASIPGVVLVLVGLFDAWAWRWPLVRRYIAQIPDIRGTWRGQLVTTWRPKGGTPMAPIPAYLVIRQTYFTVSARLLSDQSSSETVSTRLLKAADGVLTLSAVYRNTPRMNVRSTSPMHFGSFIVELQRDPVDRLVGHYWTDRGSGGDMEFVQHAATAAAGFEQASKLTFTP